MPTTLTNGIQLPDKGSVDWYNSMQSNYNLIDTHLGDTDTHVTAEDKANWDSKQGSLSQAQLDAIAQVATNTSDIASLQSGKANASHTHSSSDITDIDDYATKQYVDTSISGLVDSAPDALNTLNELSAALNDDSNFASTVTTALADKANSSDLATVATSGSYDDLTDTPTIPTNTSDLTNDSNFVDTSNSAVASGITSAKVSSYDSHIADTDIHVTTADKTKWNNGVSQSYVFRYSSTALVASSTNSNTLLDNTDNLKVGDKVIDSSGVLFSITAIDTANSTFTVGSALIDLALDANVVHTAEINSSGIGIIEAVKEVGGVDFNTLTTQGLYGANASGSTNNPENSPCVVQVIKRQKSVIQIANVSSSAYKSRYIRYCADITAQPPVWQSWVKFATDDNVMHLSGNETKSGELTLSDTLNSSDIVPLTNLNFNLGSPDYKYNNVYAYIYNSIGRYLGNEANSNQRTNITLYANRDTQNQSCAYITRFRPNRSQGALQTNDLQMIGFDVVENEVRTNNVFSIQCTNWLNNVPQRVNFLSSAQSYSYGNSNNKALINELDPGSLGMPDLSNGIDISSYIDITQTSQYTAPANGYIAICGYASSTNTILLKDHDYDFGITAQAMVMGQNTFTTYLIIPVVKNHVYDIICNAVTTLDYAKFYPCQGNV